MIGGVFQLLLAASIVSGYRRLGIALCTCRLRHYLQCQSLAWIQKGDANLLCHDTVTLISNYNSVDADETRKIYMGEIKTER